MSDNSSLTTPLHLVQREICRNRGSKQRYVFSEQQVMKSGWWSKKFWHRNTHKCIEHCTPLLPITPRSKNSLSADFATHCFQPRSPAAVLPIPHKHRLSIVVFLNEKKLCEHFMFVWGKRKFVANNILLPV